MTLPDRLRAAIAPAHAAVEETPFARGMVTGRIGRPAYAAGLAQLGHLHAALEDALLAADSAHLRAIYDPARMARAGLVGRDLRALGEADAADAPPHPAVERLAAAFAGWAADAPHRLLGALYVLEGSRMGSMVLARTLTRALGVPAAAGVGLDYHVEGIATRPADWGRLKATLAGLPLSPAEQDEAEAAAVETMDGLVELYDAVPAEAVALV